MGITGLAFLGESTQVTKDIINVDFLTQARFQVGQLSAGKYINKDKVHRKLVTQCHFFKNLIITVFHINLKLLQKGSNIFCCCIPTLLTNSGPQSPFLPPVYVEKNCKVWMGIWEKPCQSPLTIINPISVERNQNCELSMGITWLAFGRKHASPPSPLLPLTMWRETIIVIYKYTSSAKHFGENI